jgi:transposase
MPLFAGLDISLKATSVCIVDDNGATVDHFQSETDALSLCARLTPFARDLRRVGLETGTFAQHLYSALAGAGFPVICVEARHMSRVLRAQARNKNDRNDAQGIALMMRAGLFKAVHIKTERSQQLNVLLKARRILKSKLLDIEADLRTLLKNFGWSMGKVGQSQFEARVLELAASDPFLTSVMVPMLDARRAMREQYDRLHHTLLQVVQADPACRRLMTMPGVGPVTALVFRATVDVPTRFAKSRTVGAHFGLTPRQYQSGLTSRSGRISRSGDSLMRASLYEAAQVLFSNVTRPCALRAWAVRLAERRGRRKAVVALARKMGVILHRMWVNETDFRWDQQPA